MTQEHPAKNVRVMLMDEARFGQQGTLTKVSAATESRPAAVDPLTGDSSALLARHVNITTMEVFLTILSKEVGENDHVVLVMDQVSRHTSQKLKVPENITPLFLPPYSPALKAIEQLWAFVKSHYLSNRAYEDYDALLDAGGKAYRSLMPALLKSICATSWLTPENES